MLLGRQIGRRREAAVRAALGASRARLAREVFVENTVIAVAGAIAGLVAARVALPALVHVLPPEMPRLDEVTIDPVVIATIVVTSVIAVLIFGVVPSFEATPAVGPAAAARRGTD